MEERPVLIGEERLVRVAGGERHLRAALFEREAVAEIDAADRGVGLERVLVAGAELAAAVVAPQHDVDDAASRARAVDGGAGGWEHLDAFDGGERDTVEVGLAADDPHSGVVAVGSAAAVDEDKRVIGPEPA